MAADNAAYCPLCGHEQGKHDPEDGSCDVADIETLDVCQCGRDAKWMRQRLRSLAQAARAEWGTDPWPDAGDVYDDCLGADAARYVAALTPERVTALLDKVDTMAAALEEIAAVPGRSVTSIIARRALDGLR